jgi:hypothetical protein
MQLNEHRYVLALDVHGFVSAASRQALQQAAGIAKIAT